MSIFIRSILIVALALQLVCCATTSGKPKPHNAKKAHDLHIQLGTKYLNAGRRDHARRQFKSAADLVKRSPQAFNGMALVHRLNGEFDLAEKNFKFAEKYQTDATRADIAYSYGQFLVSQNRADEACSKFEYAGQDLDYPNRAVALFWAGKCAWTLGNTERAISAYKHSLNLNNKIHVAKLDLALVYFQLRDFANSKNYLDQFSAKSDHTAQSLWLGIRIERIFGNADKEASYAIALKNLHGYSKEYLKYKELLAGKISAEDVEVGAKDQEPPK